MADAEALARLGRLFLHQRDQVFEVVPGSSDVEIGEGPSVFHLTARAPVAVTFDDVPIMVHWSERRDAGFGQVDLTNQVGFHRFAIQSDGAKLVFDFRTSTAKATWNELRAMALVVAREAFAFKRQFLYTTRDGIRRAVPLPEVDAAWIRDRLPEICALVEAIDRRPATEARRVFHPSHEARGVSIPHSSRFLREHARHLEARADGPISVAGVQYWPAAVVVHKKNREPARIEHEQLTHFLSLLARRLIELQALVPPDMRVAVAHWQSDLGRARARKVLARYAQRPTHLAWTPLPTPLQRIDSRYKRLRDLHAEFLRDAQPSDENLEVARANVKDAWEIYQSFAAHMIGRALGLSYVSDVADLRERAARGFSMHSDELELYYDARPAVLTSWRDPSSRPARERPDIVLLDKVRNLVAMLDVKFRIEPDGVSARNEDLFEMQGYMESFGLASGAIVFPGAKNLPRRITGEGKLLVELPLRPQFFAPGDEDALKSLADLTRELWNSRHSVTKVDRA